MTKYVLVIASFCSMHLYLNTILDRGWKLNIYTYLTSGIKLRLWLSKPLRFDLVIVTAMRTIKNRSQTILLSTRCHLSWLEEKFYKQWFCCHLESYFLLVNIHCGDHGLSPNSVAKRISNSTSGVFWVASYEVLGAWKSSEVKSCFILFWKSKRLLAIQVYSK